MPDQTDVSSVMSASLPLSEEPYRALLQALPGMVFTTGPEGVVEFVNDRFAGYTGTTVDSLREGQWESIIHPDDLPASTAEWARAMTARATGQVEHRVRGRDGEYHWFLTRIEPLPVAGGKIAGWLGTSTDIDEQKRLEADSRELHIRAEEVQSTLQSVLEHAPVGVAFLDLDGHYEHINPSLAAMNGLPAEDSIGRHLSDVVPNLWPKVQTVFERIRAGEDAITLELSGTTPGTGAIEHTWRESWYAVRSGGELRGVGAVVEDITEHIREQQRDAVRASISELKGKALDDTALARGALVALVPAIADWATIYAICDDGKVDRTAITYGDRDATEHAALPSVDALPMVAQRAMGAGEATVVTDVNDQVLVLNALDDAHLAEMRAASVLSGLTVPMWARGRIVGALSITTNAPSGRRLTGDDLPFAREAANRIGIAIENARLQRNLAKSEELHRRLIEASPAMVFELTRDGRMTWASSSYWEYTGLDHEEPEAYDWEEQGVVHPDDLEEVVRRWRSSVATGELYENEMRLRSADGSHRWFLYRMAAQHGPDGAVAGWIGTATDIHDRVTAETRMAGALDSEQQARALLDAILQAAPVGVTVIDRDQRWIHVNETAARFNGYTVEEHLGASAPSLLPEVWRNVEPIYRRILDTGEPLIGVELELSTPGTNGEVRSWSASYFPVVRDGHVFAVAAMYADVTERTRAEQERERLVEDLKLANAAKDEFLGLVSHELKTPITTIYGNAQVLVNRGGQLTEDDREGSIGDIAHESERLHRIIDNLLVLARLDRGATPNMEPVLPGRTALRIAREHEQRFPGRTVNVNDRGGDGFVLAEPVYIEQVMRNLVSNAEKYSPRTTPIDIEISRADGSMHVAFCDRGAGFTEEEAEQMFSPFYRAPTSAHIASGIGIGLAVCKRLIEAQGGKVWARPREGGGADIGFSLPLADE